MKPLTEKTYVCENCGKFVVRRVENEIKYMFGRRELDAVESANLRDGKCPFCGKNVEPERSCLKCKFLMQRKTKKKKKFFSKGNIEVEVTEFYCEHPKVNEGVRDFERAFNCKYYSDKNHKTLEGFF